MVPGEHKDNRQADQECEERDLAELFGPVEGLTDVFETLQESPDAREACPLASMGLLRYR
jgi:hypothetical protein